MDTTILLLGGGRPGRNTILCRCGVIVIRGEEGAVSGVGEPFTMGVCWLCLRAVKLWARYRHVVRYQLASWAGE
jgi:hypothetical protein